MINIYSIAIVFSFIFLATIVELIRKNKIMEKYSIIWLFFALTVLALSTTPYLIQRIAYAIGIYYAPAILFLIVLVYIIIYNLHITVVFSKQTKMIVRLNQELAILKERSLVKTDIEKQY